MPRRRPPLSAQTIIRRACYALGLRYRLRPGDVPGRPLLAFPGRGRVIFVHNCLWHQHGCARSRCLPRRGADHWQRKIAAIVAADQQALAQLHAQHWQVMILWSCQIKAATFPRLVDRLGRFLADPEDWDFRLPGITAALQQATGESTQWDDEEDDDSLPGLDL